MTKPNNITTSKPIPNITMWAWMRTVLGLVGNELLIFSYLFSSTYDSSHVCWVALADMETWFGLTRQTISRNIDKLVDRGVVVKKCVLDEFNPIIKHNNYQVDMNRITDLCEHADTESYKNFLDCYKTEIKRMFPNDGKKIDDYFDALLSWHTTKDIKVCMAYGDLIKLAYCKNNDNLIPIDEFLNILKEHKICEDIDVNRNEKKENIVKTENKNTNKKTDKKELKSSEKTSKETKPTLPIGKLLQDKPKRRNRKAERAQWDIEKRQMTESYVITNLNGNEELKKLLLCFLDTDNGQSYTPMQWEIQLDNMYKHGRTIPRMIEGVRNSFMNNYRSLYLVDKNEVDIDLKLCEIQKYVLENADGNEELKNYLELYILETQKGKSLSQSQFTLLLSELSTICETTEQKIASVKNSYAGSYSKLAYAPSGTSKGSGHSGDGVTPIDTDKKLEQIDKFIEDGCYYLIDGLKESLIEYVTNTQVGSTMTVEDFITNLASFRLNCLVDGDKTNKVREAIRNNYPKLAMEDFSETRQISQNGRTREDVARVKDKNRRKSIFKEFNINPKNPRLKGLKKESFK